MIHGMALQSGGRLILKSRKGEGTVVELWLPIESSKREAASQHHRSAEQRPLGSMSALTILAVDDDSLVLLNTIFSLEDLGHTVIEASSGKQALAMLRQGKAVDLMIADQGMPQMTGAEFAQAVKAEWPNIRIVLTTGYGQLPQDTDPNLLMLAKPFRQEDLARIIREAICAEQPSRRVLKFPRTDRSSVWNGMRPRMTTLGALATCRRLDRISAFHPNRPYSSQVAFRQQILKVMEFDVNRT